MKRLFLFVLLAFSLGAASAQYVVYFSLKNLIANQGDTITYLEVEKRTKNVILLQGGADYKISHPTDKVLSNHLKRRPFAVYADSSLYVNCKRVRYKKLRFGAWYAPAFVMRGNIYFSAVPLGSVVAKSSYSMGSNIGGDLGKAIASSSLVSKRVYYEVDGQTGEVVFVSRDRLLELLADYPELADAYKCEESESARVTGKYLRLLCDNPK